MVVPTATGVGPDWSAIVSSALLRLDLGGDGVILPLPALVSDFNPVWIVYVGHFQPSSQWWCPHTSSCSLNPSAKWIFELFPSKRWFSFYLFLTLFLYFCRLLVSSACDCCTFVLEWWNKGLFGSSGEQDGPKVLSIIILAPLKLRRICH